MKSKNLQADAPAERIIKICRLYESIPVDKQNQILGLISFIIDALPDPSVKSWLAQLRSVLESLRKAGVGDEKIRSL
jgi:hypothetical protein